MKAKSPMTLRNRIVACLPTWLRATLSHMRSRALLSPHARASFSQEGEDLLVARMFDTQGAGFYVDIGAHHPTRFSNTYLLYTMGWRGINIDATPGSMDAFRKLRPDDINLEIAVSSDGQPQRFYLFDEPALNSASTALSTERDEWSDYSITSTVILPTRPLRDVLSEHLPQDIDGIDLMTIDVEGHDLDVLISNDWDRFRPRVLLIEVLAAGLEDLDGREEIALLRQHGYVLYAKLVNTVVLVDARSNPSRSGGPDCGA